MEGSHAPIAAPQSLPANAVLNVPCAPTQAEAEATISQVGLGAVRVTGVDTHATVCGPRRERVAVIARRALLRRLPPQPVSQAQ